MMQPAVPETRQLREERIQRARPPSYEYGIEILATLYVVSSLKVVLGRAVCNKISGILQAWQCYANLPHIFPKTIPVRDIADLVCFQE